MKITIKKSYEPTPRSFSFEGAFRFYLDGGDYEAGVMEEAVGTSHNNSAAIGRLVELLHRRGVLNSTDIGGLLELSSFDGVLEVTPE